MFYDCCFPFFVFILFVNFTSTEVKAQFLWWIKIRFHGYFYLEMIAKSSHFSLQLQADKLMADEENRIAQWESFMKEQQNKQAEVDEEHRKAMERLKEQYSEMEKELDKYISF